ncbi:MAG: ABC transporter ATP-binding protein, partial [Clostridiales bacterium]|nr:ABC transporter ATP-binding protein [Clostridiales bacterium]
MNRLKKFISYYKPHKKLFFADMFFALIAAGITLVYPLIVRYITNDVLVNYEISEAIGKIVGLIVLMLALAILEYISNFFVTYKGHVMGTLIERDMRNDIFSHYQKLSFNYYDNQKTGQLLTRITNDLFDITELSHHGPEDIVISVIKFIGAFVILLQVNVPLTLIIFIFIPIMFIFANKLRKKMRDAFRRNRESIAAINAGVEDSLSGIRVVKSFANEEREMERFSQGNDNFVESKRKAYWCMAQFHSGLNLFINLMNVAVVAGGALFIANKVIVLTDLITFLLYIGNI